MRFGLVSLFNGISNFMCQMIRIFKNKKIVYIYLKTYNEELYYDLLPSIF